VPSAASITARPPSVVTITVATSVPFNVTDHGNSTPTTQGLFVPLATIRALASRKQTRWNSSSK